MNDLVTAIKRAVMEAVENSQPCALYTGTVVSVTPLKVQVDQKTLLTAAQLLLSSLVRDVWVEMTVDHETEDESPPTGHTHRLPTAGVEEQDWPIVQRTDFDAAHRHAYRGRKGFTVHLALQPGERVLLLRQQDGQHFLILDRLRGEGG